jgi:ATP-dependent protease Clp, ATPase subunit
MEKTKTYYGMLFQNIFMSEGTIIFKPVDVLESNLVISDVFTSNNGSEYSTFTNVSIFVDKEEHCVGAIMTEEGLLKTYQTDDIYKACEAYGKEMKDRIFIGRYNDHDYCVEIVEYKYKVHKNMIYNSYVEDEESLTDAEAFIVKRTEIGELLAASNIEDMKALLKKKFGEADLKEAISFDTEEDAMEYARKLQENKQTEPQPEQELDKDDSINYEIDTQKLFWYVSKRVIGQDKAIKEAIRILKRDKLAESPTERVRGLLVGPTGVGKTQILRELGQALDVPFLKMDATQLTKAGYVGQSIESMLKRLLAMTKNNLETAENAVVFIDELDKKGSEKGDPTGSAVLDMLLPFLEGEKYTIEYRDQHKPDVTFDTSRLTIFLGGAFTSVYKGKKYQLKKNNGIGFNSILATNDSEQITLETEDFIKYGDMTDELMGRITSIIQLNELDEKNFVDILRFSENSPLLIEKEVLAKEHVLLKWTPHFLVECAKKAAKSNKGARTLKKIINEILSEAESEIFDNSEDYVELRLTKKAASNPLECILLTSTGEQLRLAEILEKKKTIQKRKIRV